MTEPAHDMTLIRPPPLRLATAWRQGDCGVTLCALQSYWDAPPDERARVCNGAGTAWVQAWLPKPLRCLQWFANRLWGLDCREAFDIHDWDFLRMPATADGFRESNQRLADNLRRIIESKTKCPPLLWARRRNARRYVYLVSEWGYKAYYDRG